MYITRLDSNIDNLKTDSCTRKNGYYNLKKKL